MKNSHVSFRVAAGLIAIFFLPGCLEHSVTTTIRPDGTCERLISVSSRDSTDAFSFPLRSDGSWKIEMRWEKRDSAKERKFVRTARKNFQSMEALAAEYTDTTGSLSVRITGERRFRWLYTYFSYRESYATAVPFVRIPIAPYMTDDEIVRYQNGDSGDTLKKKAEEWYQRCLFEELFGSLCRAADDVQDTALTRRHFEEKKERLFRRLMLDDRDIHTSADAVAIMDTILQSPKVHALTPVVDSVMQSLERREKQYEAVGDSYVNTIIMPGVILETNAPELVGNTVVWKTDAERLRIRRFDMIVESRVINVWAIVVTGLAAFALLLAALWAGTMRRRVTRIVPPPTVE